MSLSTQLKLTIASNCTACGICAEVCPACIIGLENNTPILKGESCIQCGHCEAACPHNALTNQLLNHESTCEIEKYPILDAETAEMFLRARRSIRCFRDDIVSREETEKLINIGRYAQTGSNSQGVSYIVVSSKEKMDALKKLTLAYFSEQTDPLVKRMYQRFASSDKDIVFRGAPMCILALTGKSNPYTTANARYSLTYIELFAPSLNLGTCWAGYFERYASSDSEELRELLEIPNELKISGALLFGYPKYRYYRLANRNALNLKWIPSDHPRRQ